MSVLKIKNPATGLWEEIAPAALDLLNRANHTGTQAAATVTGLATVATSGSAADLTGTLAAARIADGSLPLGKLGTDPLARAGHTGTQTAATISDFAEAVDDEVNTLIVAGSGITKIYDDVANTLTLSASGGGGGAAPMAPTSAGVMTNRWLMPGWVRTGQGDTVFTAVNGVTYYWPIFVDSPVSVDGLIVRPPVGTAGTSALVGLLATDAAWQPTSVVFQTGPLDTSTGGNKVETFAPVTLAVGVYLVALRVNGTLAVSGILGSPSRLILGATSGEAHWTRATHFTVSETFGPYTTNPTDWTAVDVSGSAGTMPLPIFVRFA